MITLMLICTLIGITMQLSGLFIFIAFSLYVFFIVYFLDGISLLSLSISQKIPGKLVSFIPVFRGINEGQAISKMIEDTPSKKLPVLFFVERLSGFALIALFYNDFYDHYTSISNILFASVNSVFAYLTSFTHVGYELALLVVFVIFYLIGTFIRSRYFRKLGCKLFLSFIIALLTTYVFGIVVAIIGLVKSKRQSPL